MDGKITGAASPEPERSSGRAGEPQEQASSTKPTEQSKGPSVLKRLADFAPAKKIAAKFGKGGAAEAKSADADEAVTEQETRVSARLDRLLTANDLRDVSRFHVEGGALSAAKALEHADRVMILTGFSVDHTDPANPASPGLPETDGPPGAAALAHALWELGKVVTFVTDKANEPVLRAAVKALNPEAEQYARFDVMDAPHAGHAASRQADALLDKHRPDAVVAIELPSRNENGERLNMRGKNINGFNAPVDQLLINARRREDITTVGVGDGGNDAGMGGLAGIPKALDGATMAAAVPADHPVTAWNSNLGATAIGAVMLQRAGKLDKLLTGEQQDDAIRATIKAGAVDGVTRGREVNQPTADGRNYTGVDGHSLDVHRGMLELLRTNVAQLPPGGIVAKRSPDHDKPFLVGLFDSGNGGLIAAQNVAKFLQYRMPRKARLVIVTDHGSGAYGDKEHEELVSLVAKGLKTGEDVGVDVIAMACNTACTAFPTANDGISVPVLDLIETTAEQIVNHGGDRPAMLSTQRTAESPDYPSKIAQYARAGVDQSKRNVRLRDGYAIGAPGWAERVNNLDHLSTDPEVSGEVDATVAEYVDKVPRDATSLWLCCTHYPALKERIEKRLEERGMGHIPVIDPMEYQADRIITTLEDENIIVRHDRLATFSPVVLTTSTEAGIVERSAQKLMDATDTQVIHTQFGEGHTIELISPLRAGQKSVTQGRLKPLRLPTRRTPEQGDHPPGSSST
jgi:glutamate racemase